MVVTSSRKAAVRWAREMNRYITEKGYEFHSLVAFSDAVRMEDEPDPVTEVSMNGESDVERAFKDDDLDYRVLIVANKFQTGFNEPRLCAMYVDKHLDLTPVRSTPDIQPGWAGKKGNLPPCLGTPNSSNVML